MILHYTKDMIQVLLPIAMTYIQIVQVIMLIHVVYVMVKMMFARGVLIQRHLIQIV